MIGGIEQAVDHSRIEIAADFRILLQQIGKAPIPLPCSHGVTLSRVKAKSNATVVSRAMTRSTEECENVVLVPQRHVFECRHVWRDIPKEPGLEFAATVTVITDVSSVSGCKLASAAVKCRSGE
jgi:hypothetical protein